MTLYLLLAAVLLAADLAIKGWVVAALQPVGSIPLISGVFSLYYHENRGAAWGILQGQRWPLIIVTGLLLLGLIAAVVLKKFPGVMVNLSFALIIAGGLGNLADRALRGYVVDYLYFELINFPIFNFADICVVCGTILLMIYVVFLEEKKKPNPIQAQEKP